MIRLGLLITLAILPIPRVNTQCTQTPQDYKDLERCVKNCFETVKYNNIGEQFRTCEYVNTKNVEKEAVKRGTTDAVLDGCPSKSKRRSKTKTDEKRQNCITEKVSETYEFPKVPRITPAYVGEMKEIELEDGKYYTRITKSLQPPIFEIPGFLSEEECKLIISTAKNVGMSVSKVHGTTDVIQEINSGKNLSDISRISQTGWLFKHHLEEVMLKLRKRVSTLTDVPLDVIDRSEPLQVVSYSPGGHYHAHTDSFLSNNNPECCFHSRYAKRDCSLNRYITVMFYLNDVEEGGETAFPFADMDIDSMKLKKNKTKDWNNLSRSCDKASLLVTPEMGKAVMWYNHEVGDMGYIGKGIQQSYHGGCDVIRGSKWIANFWINWPVYENRFL